MPNDSITTLIIGDPGGFEILKELTDADVVGVIEKRDEVAATRFRRTLERARAVREEVVTDPDLAVEYYQLQARTASRDELLARDLGLLESLEEKVARVDLYHRFSDVGSMLLFDDVECRGDTRFFTAAWPNFKWSPYCFNDRASSGIAWGVNALWEHTWFKGEKHVFAGFPWMKYPDFRLERFNDKASSYAGI